MRSRHRVLRRLRRQVWPTAAQRRRELGWFRSSLKFTLRDVGLLILILAVYWAEAMPGLRSFLRFLDGVSGPRNATSLSGIKLFAIAAVALGPPIAAWLIVVSVKWLAALVRHLRTIRRRRIRRRPKAT